MQKLTVNKALSLIESLPSTEVITLEFNDESYCAKTEKPKITKVLELNKKSGLGETIVFLHFDGIDELIESERKQDEQKRFSQVERSHIDRIVRDLNDLCSNYINELALSVSVSVFENLTKPYFIQVHYEGINKNASICAEHIAEMAHLYIGQCVFVKDKTDVDVHEHNS